MESEALCRLCKKTFLREQTSSLFVFDWPNKLFILTSIMVTESDSLPQNACFLCLSKLDDVIKFRDQCIAADRELRQIANLKSSQLVEVKAEIVVKSPPDSSSSPEETKSNDPIRAENDSTPSSNLRKRRLKSVRIKKESDQSGFRIVKNCRNSRSKVGDSACDKTVKNQRVFQIKKEGEVRLEGDESETKNVATIRRKKKKAGPLICQHCSKKYPSVGGLRYHIHTTHSQNYRPFFCSLCCKSFKVKKNLEAHTNSIHLKLKQHLCDLCGRGFATKYSLQVHKICHADERNFECEICTRRFRTRGKLNTHRSVHDSQKKFICEICSKDFRWKKDLDVHMRSHTGEKPYLCGFCMKGFSSSTNRKKHEKCHTDGSQLRIIEAFSDVKEDIADVDVPEDICEEFPTIAYAL